MSSQFAMHPCPCSTNTCSCCQPRYDDGYTAFYNNAHGYTQQCATIASVPYPPYNIASGPLDWQQALYALDMSDIAASTAKPFTQYSEPQVGYQAYDEEPSLLDIASWSSQVEQYESTELYPVQPATEHSVPDMSFTIPAPDPNQLIEWANFEFERASSPSGPNTLRSCVESSLLGHFETTWSRGSPSSSYIAVGSPEFLDFETMSSAGSTDSPYTAFGSPGAVDFNTTSSAGSLGSEDTAVRGPIVFDKELSPGNFAEFGVSGRSPPIPSRYSSPRVRKIPSITNSARSTVKRQHFGLNSPFCKEETGFKHILSDRASGACGATSSRTYTQGIRPSSVQPSQRTGDVPVLEARKARRESREDRRKAPYRQTIASPSVSPVPKTGIEFAENIFHLVEPPAHKPSQRRNATQRLYLGTNPVKQAMIDIPIIHWAPPPVKTRKSNRSGR